MLKCALSISNTKGLVSEQYVCICVFVFPQSSTGQVVSFVTYTWIAGSYYIPKDVINVNTQDKMKGTKYLFSILRVVVLCCKVMIVFFLTANLVFFTFISLLLVFFLFFQNPQSGK